MEVTMNYYDKSNKFAPLLLWLKDKPNGIICIEFDTVEKQNFIIEVIQKEIPNQSIVVDFSKQTSIMLPFCHSITIERIEREFGNNKLLLFINLYNPSLSNEYAISFRSCFFLFRIFYEFNL